MIRLTLFLLWSNNALVTVVRSTAYRASEGLIRHYSEQKLQQLLYGSDQLPTLSPRHVHAHFPCSLHSYLASSRDSKEREGIVRPGSLRQAKNNSRSFDAGAIEADIQIGSGGKDVLGKKPNKYPKIT